MSQFFAIHPENPQLRLVRMAAEIIRGGGVVIYPTDSAYALGRHIGDKKALERIRQIRQLDKKHNFSLVCRDLSELATYARVNNQQYRAIKSHTPGPYTFILQATAEVPRRLLHPKRKTIGIRVPDNKIALAILGELGEPMMSTTMLLPGDSFPLTDPYDIRDTLEHQVDLIIDGGYCGMEETSVIDMSTDSVEVLRAGMGSVEEFSA